MAVFFLNHCKFNGCGLSFPNLLELIQHIEEIHIETLTDPAAEAAQETQQPSCLPLSSVLRFFNPGAPRNGPRKHPLGSKSSGGPPTKILKLGHNRSSSPGQKGGNGKTQPTLNSASHLSSLLVASVKSSVGGSSVGGSSVGTPSSTRESTPVSALSNSPPVSDSEETLVSENEDSNDSWTTQDEIPADLIIKLASKSHTNAPGEDKPFVCPVVGCRKRYKNVNGIKYHAKNAHKKDSKVRKPYRCYCGKSYCTNQGLKNHCTHTHKHETMTSVTTNTGEVLQVPATQLTSASSAQLLSDSSRALTTSIASQVTKDVEGSVQVNATTTAGSSIGQIAVTGQLVKGGALGSKGATTLSSINLSSLMASGGGKIALKALPNGQLLLSQPVDGKLTTLVKSDNRHDLSVDDGKTNLLHIKADGFQQLELGKLLQLNKKSPQMAVTTSTLSLAIPASSLTYKGNTRGSTPVLARALKSPVVSKGGTGVMGLDSQSENGGLGGQGVILGVTMEEGTLIDNGDGTLSELSVID